MNIINSKHIINSQLILHNLFKERISEKIIFFYFRFIEKKCNFEVVRSVILCSENFNCAY